MSTYNRRSAEERIEALNAQIAGIREREERAKLRQDPVAQQARLALRAIDKALSIATEETVRGALMQSRHSLAATIEIMGGVAKAPTVEAQQRRGRRAGPKADVAS